MRPIRETLPLDEALALVYESASPITRTERVPLREATGRVIAAAAVAAVDVPPFDRAAMDGYAVVAEDTFGAGRYDPRILHCIEKVYTGEVPTRRLERGQCTEIATGAPMPDGADAVVMVEESEKTADDVRIFTPVYPRQHVGRRAADIAAGQALLDAGAFLNASRVGALAAIGAFDVEVFAKPTVAILSTGNEIIEPGSPLRPGQIYDINHFTITSVVQSHGGIADRVSTRARQSARSRRRDPQGCRSRHRRVLRRQLGRRARPDPRCDPGDRRGDLPRDRGEARQADSVWTRRRDTRVRHAGLSRPPACRTPTCCCCRCCGGWRGCPSSGRR